MVLVLSKNFEYPVHDQIPDPQAFKMIPAIFFRSNKTTKTPHIFTKSNEGLHPQGEGLAFKANTGAQILGAWRAQVLHRWCITCILWRWPLGCTCIKTIRCVACHSRRNWKMSSLLSEMAATCPKTVARINSSQNRVYACAAFAETPWHSVPSFGVVFILGQIHWTLRWYSFSLTKQPKQVLDFEACGLLYSYLSRLWERIVGFNGAFFLLQFHWPRTRPGSIRLAVKKCGPFERAVVPALGPKLGRPNGSLQLYTMEDSHGTYKSSISKGTWSSKPVWLHPRNLTWNLKISPWKRKVLLETIIFRFHVKFRGCMFHVNLQGYTSNSIFTQIFLLKLASKADGFVKISPELMTRNFHGRLGTTLLQVATDWMDQINIWPNAPENHREGRARLGWFCWGFDGGGCLDDSQEYWNQRISFFLWRTPDRSLLHMEKLHLLCVGELVF